MLGAGVAGLGRKELRDVLPAENRSGGHRKFIEGDSDRPIVTGRVHNAESQPPVDLPGGKTTSTIKTRSSPGGSTANFNEIRFEDRKGSERIFVQAERDYALVVKGAQSGKVGGKQTTRVDEGLETSAKTIQLSGDESIKITAKDEESSTIEMDAEIVTIKAKDTKIVMDAIEGHDQLQMSK